MRGFLIAMVLVGAAFSSASAVDRCAAPYVEFMERLNQRASTLSGERLAKLNRAALRIYDACDTGHLQNAEMRLRQLDAS